MRATPSNKEVANETELAYEYIPTALCTRGAAAKSEIDGEDLISRSNDALG